MSGVQVAVMPAAPGSRAAARPADRARGDNVVIRTLAFGLLGLYAVLRWGTLLGNGSTGRLMGLLALAVVLAAVGPLLADVSRLLAGGVMALGCLAALAIAGLPLDWVVNLRVAVGARAIGDGLSALPGVNVPYTGLDPWIHVTIILGAAVLLLDAAFVLTFVPRRFGALRRAGAALPLVALAVIPATVLRPVSPYLEGMLLFALVVLFMWGENLRHGGLAVALVPCTLALGAAMVLAPSIDPKTPWINYQALATSLASGGVETFDWNQAYGPILWPRIGRTVLEVQAAHPDYWKAENLDVFDGQSWTASSPPAVAPWQDGVSASALHRWTESLLVTVRWMGTNKVIAAGSANPPLSLVGGAVPGPSSGTWQASVRLGPGDTYRVSVYSPHPSVAQLSAAGTAYPAAIQQGYLSLMIPTVEAGQRSPGSGSAPGQVTPVAFAPFGSSHSIAQSTVSYFGAAAPSAGAVSEVMARSPYAAAYALARRLRAGATTPYAYVARVQAFLDHGYRYNEHPPASRYPLESFLFQHKLGYCQHFAGAMALLLRMGGVPARVSAGFTPGLYNPATHRWAVSDVNAHAWVEAWFPQYGWVRFDPTPGSDPALKGTSTAKVQPAGGTASAPLRIHHREIGTAAPVTSGLPAAHASAPNYLPEILAPVLLLALLLAVALLTMARSGQDPMAELVRAYRRTGRPLDTESTLAGLEHRLSHSPDAAAYVRRLRLARFAGATRSGSLRQRRALRRALGDSLGPIGRLRAWWAVPPRWQAPSRGPRPPADSPSAR